MIKAEYKGNNIEVEVTGDGATVLAELTCAVRDIHEEIEKARGKKVADEEIKRVFKRALMSEEELNEEYEANKALLQLMNDLLTGGTK